jgi:hypothetical protein
MKKVRVILSSDAEEVFKYLNKKSIKSKTERMIFNSVKKKVELIKSNPHFGNPMSKKLIPKEYIEKYGITNLFRVELPAYWRMLYSLSEGDNKVEIIAFVLDLIDHKKYDKKLGYK